jgi:hypothetical protein
VDNLDNKKIITAPDTDYSRCFKIMLIDFEWEDITQISEVIKKLPVSTTVFLYCEKDNNVEWCLSQAKQSTGVLLNMREQSNLLLKGFLLGESNVYSYGYHMLDKVFTRNIIDYHSWIALQYRYYVEVANVETKHT